MYRDEVLPKRRIHIAIRKRQRRRACLEQDIQAAAASERGHDTGAETAGRGAAATTPTIVGVVALLWGIALLRRVVHLLALRLAVVALLGRVALLLWVALLLMLLRVVALTLRGTVVVRGGALGRRGVRLISVGVVIDRRWVRGGWAGLERVLVWVLLTRTEFWKGFRVAYGLVVGHVGKRVMDLGSDGAEMIICGLEKTRKDRGKSRRQDCQVESRRENESKGGAAEGNLWTRGSAAAEYGENA